MRHRPVLLLLLLGLMALPDLSLAQPACTHYASPTGNQDGSSPNTPFRISNFPAQPGQVLCLLNGTYTQDNIEHGAGPQGLPGSPVTVRAVNDGGVLIDGQFARRTLFLNGTAYWTIQGIDFGNSTEDAASLYPDSNHLVIQRVCFWNAMQPQAGVYSNLHTIAVWNSHENLLEDVCAFGYGRNTFLPFEDATKNNVFRRLWLRWDGWPDGAGATCPAPTIQTQYHTHHSNDVYENFVTIFSGGLYPPMYSGPSDPNHQNGFPCGSLEGGWVTRTGMLDGVAGPSWLGQILYGYSDHNDIIASGGGVGMRSRYTAMHIADVFTDARWARADNGNFNIYACDVADPADPNLAVGGSCSQLFIDRVTSVVNAGQATGTLGPSGANLSNIQECTSLGACPNLYTGTGPSTGSRACFEYANGTLTTTPLWPWRMDDRIKQALARSGITPSLSGPAGTGYAAGTVTSEIALRYGAIPSQCLRGGVAAVAQTAWWKFDDNTGTTANDALPPNNPIALNAGAGWGTPRVGVASLRCTGTAIGPDTADVVFDNPLYTWMVWLRSDTDPSNTIFQAPLANGPTNNPGGSDAWGLWWSSADAPGTNGVQSIFHRDSSGQQLFKIPVTLAAHLWYHLAVTFDGATVRLYVNGAPQGSFAAGTPITPGGPPQVCGRYFPTPWAGELDELILTDHALTAAEVLTEYQRGAASNPNRVAHKMLAQ